LEISEGDVVVGGEGHWTWQISIVEGETEDPPECLWTDMADEPANAGF
jgi:hypothetical protein